MLLAILRKQGFEDIRVKLFEDARKFSIDILKESVHILIHSKLEKCILLDALVLCSFGGFLTSRQVHIFSELANVLGVHDELKTSVVDLALHVLGLIEFDSDSDVDLSNYSMWNVFLPHCEKMNRQEVAATPDLPIYLQRRFAFDAEEDVVSVIAASASLAEDLMFELNSIGSQNIKIALASNKSLPHDLQHQLFDMDSDEVKKSLAVNPALLDELQNKLASDSSWQVRAALASNPSVLEEILNSLSIDDDPDVRAAVAKNPSISIMCMIQLLGSENRSVNLGLAENIQIPESLQMALLNESDEVIRARLARNPSISESVQNKLATDRKSVQIALSKNPRLKIGVQKNLLSSADIDVMVNLHQNKAVADEIQIKIENTVSEDDLISRRNRHHTKWIESLEFSKEIMRAYTALSEYSWKQFEDSGWFSSWSQSENDKLERRVERLEKQGRELDNELSEMNKISDLLENVLAHKKLRDSIK
jgi:hypothetical protein